MKMKEVFDVLFVYPKNADLRPVSISLVHSSEYLFSMDGCFDWAQQMVWGTSNGTLAVYHLNGKLLSLVDVLTGKTRPLPQVVTFSTSPMPYIGEPVFFMSERDCALIKKICVSKDSVFVLYDKPAKFDCHNNLTESFTYNCMSHITFAAKHCWVDHNDSCFSDDDLDEMFNTEWTDFMEYNTLLYGCNRYGNLYEFLEDFSVTCLVAPSPQPPVFEDKDVRQRTYLVDVGDQFVMVFRLSRRHYKNGRYMELTENFDIYELEYLRARDGKLNLLHTIGKWAIFLGKNESFAVPSEEFSLVLGNRLLEDTVYFTDDIGSSQDSIFCYSFSKKSICPYHHNVLVNQSFSEMECFSHAFFTYVAGQFNGAGETSCGGTEVCDAGEAQAGDDGASDVGCLNWKGFVGKELYEAGKGGKESVQACLVYDDGASDVVCLDGKGCVGKELSDTGQGSPVPANGKEDGVFADVCGGGEEDIP